MRFPKAHAAKVHLRLEQSEPDLLVEADTDKVRQALNNLVQNAIEAVAQMESGTVIVRARQRNQKEAIVEVEDDGIGLCRGGEHAWAHDFLDDVAAER